MDFLVKQRVVGAIVLVALGVIFIPMLLEGPQRTLVPKMEELPEPVEHPLSEPLQAFPAPDSLSALPPRSVVTEAAPQAQQTAEPETQPEPIQPPPESEPIQPPPAPQQAVKAGPLDSWVVQVGSFSSQQNAVALRDKLRAAGFTTQVEQVSVQGKQHFRVRVGPFLQRSEAEQNQTKLEERFQLKGRVLTYP